MTDLIYELTEAVENIMFDLGINMSVPYGVSSSKYGDLRLIGDKYQYAGCIKASKDTGITTNDMMKAMEKLADNKLIETVETKPMGIILITPSDYAYAGYANSIWSNQCVSLRLPKVQPKYIIMDYGGPNMAKPMHVGHMRSAILGDTLYKMFEKVGHTVLSDIHYGDYGIHMGIVAIEMMDDDTIDTPDAMGMAYKRGRERYHTCEDYRIRVVKRTYDMQNTTCYYQRKIVDTCLPVITKTYDRLGIRFDEYSGESDFMMLHGMNAYSYGPQWSRKILGVITKERDGTRIIRVDEPDDNKEYPPLMIQNSDKLFGYGATDMMTMVERLTCSENVYLCEDETGASDVTYESVSEIVYVVDQRQSLHFEQLFRAAKKVFPDTDCKFAHIGFGTVNGEDNKPLKTREGDNMSLEELLDVAQAKALERVDASDLGGNTNVPYGTRKRIARIISTAAIRYSDLKNNRMTNYKFDINRALDNVGMTAPYILYTAVRLNKLVKDTPLPDQAHGITIQADEERTLLTVIAQYSRVFDKAYHQREPHHLAVHLYDLAKAASQFYSKCRVQDQEHHILASRIKLASLALWQIEDICGLLGLEIPPFM